LNDAVSTIAAIATAAGRAGIGIVRVSGPRCRAIAQALVGDVPPPRVASLRRFMDRDEEAIDAGLVLFFTSPVSSTGEDMLELQGHGGAIVMDRLLQRVLELGAELAAPGEFTQRAFLNGKLDLAQAEAVADLIDSGSAQAAQAAMRSLQGEFSAEVTELAEAILELRMWVEAAIDFPDEDVDFLADRALDERTDALRQRFDVLAEKTRHGALLRDGLTVVIAGRPNAGKSSLLNRLAGYEAAIVTPIAGTTRDVLRERIQIDGLPLHVLDTAGLRTSTDSIEAEGVRRARAEIERADRVLYVIDAADPHAVRASRADLETLPKTIPVTIVMNKIDLLGQSPGLEPGPPPRVAVAVKTGAGLRQLREHLKACAGYVVDSTGSLSARRRHLDALARARRHVEEACRHLSERRAGELVAQEFRDAQRALGEITGEVTNEDLLGRIFGSFCIGK
jgi:tRNA modification GTPase